MAILTFPFIEVKGALFEYLLWGYRPISSSFTVTKSIEAISVIPYCFYFYDNVAGDPNEICQALQSLYVRAKSLMLEPKGYKLLLTLLFDICQCFEILTNLLEAFDKESVSN